MKIERILGKSLQLSLLLLGKTGLIAKGASADNSLFVEINFQENINSFEQVTKVDRLRDVSPGDWADEALRSLVERYGCIVGYPNQTYRGQQPLSRYEFAAGLNACLNQIERLIASSEAVTREDIETLQRLTQDFEAELATLGTRVDSLEGRVAFLEDHQFSTTTTLSGQIILGMASILTGNNADGDEVDRVPVFGNRTRLVFNTSFTGEDLLYTQISAGNFPFFNTGTFEGDLGFAFETDNDVGLGALLYYFPVGNNIEVVLEVTGGVFNDFTDTLNPLDRYDDSASGAISFFGTRNPIYNQGAEAGIGIITQLGDNFEVSLGYLTETANDSSQGSGLFNGPYAALGQIVFQPIDSLKFALTYVHAYNASDTFTGSSLANLRTLTEIELGEAVPTSSNSYGVQASWQLSERFIISGWAGYINTKALSTLNGALERGHQDIWNWGVTLAFPDLGKEGSLGGVVVGMEPRVTNSSIVIPGLDSEDRDTSLHVEAFYQYQVNDNIAITPGVVWITAPDFNNDNDDLVIGTIRTTFTF
ncbi:MAG: iron uptake porin [Xenococcaceae cyanobacterium MO_188.B32]|nr:iron uptake porin [Xenococcaceae cyanobacterium MO_188.B32]